MENKRFEIAFTSKEGNKVKLTLSASWLIADSTAADFKKVMKEYFMNDTDTDKINSYIDFIREKLETWNKTENGNNKTVKSKLTALDMFSGKKASKKSNFEKAANIILKNAKKSANTNIHNAIIENDNVYVTDSFVIIKTANKNMYNGFIAENGLKCEQLFTSFSNNNDICKVSLPDIKTVKDNCTKGKKNSFFVTFDHALYDINLIYTAMLAVSFDNANNCYAYKKEDNALSLLYLENTENNTSALIMPIKPRETALMNAVQNNTNVIISCDENNNIIGITSCNADSMETVKEDPETDNNSVAAYDTETETAQAENDNTNVLEYLKAHYMPPVSYETVMNMIQIQRSSECVTVSDNIIKNIKQFVTDISAAYGELYVDMEKERKAYPYMVAAENFIKDPDNEKLLSAIINERGDLFTSDRELKSLGIALAHYNYPIGNYLSAVNIAGVDMFTSDAERLISAKKYIVKAHSVYQIVPDKNGGYKGKRVYKTSKTHMPLVRSGRYITADRERVQYMINRAIPDYYSNSAVMTC